MEQRVGTIGVISAPVVDDVPIARTRHGEAADRGRALEHRSGACQLSVGRLDRLVVALGLVAPHRDGDADEDREGRQRRDHGLRGLSPADLGPDAFGHALHKWCL